DYTNTLRARGMARDPAILEANRVRLRPILMTTLMLILGMVPIALGQGPGSGSRGSLARVIIGGQALSLLITLLITPVAYALFDDLGTRWLPGWLTAARTRLGRLGTPRVPIASPAGDDGGRKPAAAARAAATRGGGGALAEARAGRRT